MRLTTQTSLGSLGSALPMLLGLLALTACDAGDLAGPPGPDAAEPIAPRSAAATTAGGPTAPWTVPGVHLLDPIVTSSVPPGTPDVTLLDLLEVEICAWSGDTCDPVRTFDADSDGPARLHLGDDGEYRTVWQTRNDAPGLYRVRVLASGGELAHADVEIVDPRGGGRNGEAEWVRITRRSSLPVAFLVEEGVGLRMGAAGGRIELAGGAVALDIPPGALDRDVLITASPADPDYDGASVVPGTAWDLGPDGLDFDAPVRMSIRFDASRLPPGVEPNTLRIHEIVGSQAVELPDGAVDLQNQVVSATVDGFSIFALLPAAGPAYQIVSLHPGVALSPGGSMLVGDDGQIVFVDSNRQYWSYSGGVVQPLPGVFPTVFEVGPGGTAVGWDIVNNTFLPTIWVNGQKSTLPGGPGRAFDINSNGQILGDREDGTGVIWTNGAVSEVIAVPGQYLRVRYLNDRGAVLGHEILPASRQAFVWDRGSRTPIPSVAPNMNIGASVSSEYLSNGGFAIGSWSNATASGAWYYDGSATASVPDRGLGATLLSINSHGVAVGSVATSQAPAFNRMAVVYDGSALTELGTFGGASSVAHGINDAGIVVGEAMNSTGDHRAFAYDGVSLHDLGTLGGNESRAVDINEAGVIVGTAQDAGGIHRAVAWIPVGG